MRSSQPLEGRIALVTGAAGGQGRSHARTLAELGADIIAVDIGPDPDTTDPSSHPGLVEVLKSVSAAGRRGYGVLADVTDLDGLSAGVAEAVAALGGLQIVVANAGIAGLAQGGTASISAVEWRRMLEVNLTGAWNTACATDRHLAAGGAVVFIASLAAVKAYPGLGHYAAAKAGVVSLTKTLALEYGPRGIRVNCILPTEVNTPMLTSPEAMRLYLPAEEDPTPEALAQITRELHVLDIPWVEPADVSEAVAFLVSDCARYITGVSLPVDGGALLK